MTEGSSPRDIVHLNFKTTGTRADDPTNFDCPCHEVIEQAGRTHASCCTCSRQFVANGCRGKRRSRPAGLWGTADIH